MKPLEISSCCSHTFVLLSLMSCGDNDEKSLYNWKRKKKKGQSNIFYIDKFDISNILENKLWKKLCSTYWIRVPELFIDKAATWRDQFSLVTWLLEAILVQMEHNQMGRLVWHPAFAHVCPWHIMASNRKLMQLFQYTALSITMLVLCLFYQYQSSGGKWVRCK